MRKCQSQRAWLHQRGTDGTGTRHTRRPACAPARQGVEAGGVERATGREGENLEGRGDSTNGRVDHDEEPVSRRGLMKKVGGAVAAGVAGAAVGSTLGIRTGGRRHGRCRHPRPGQHGRRGHRHQERGQPGVLRGLLRSHRPPGVAVRRRPDRPSPHGCSGRATSRCWPTPPATGPRSRSSATRRPVSARGSVSGARPATASASEPRRKAPAAGVWRFAARPSSRGAGRSRSARDRRPGRSRCR